MVTAMPVPIEFRLPEGWTAASPDAIGAPNVAFAALHTASQGPGFTTNITIDGGTLSEGALLTELADESITHLRQAGADVALTQRIQVGTQDSPGLMQLLKVTASIQGRAENLKQCQVYLEMVDTEDRSKRAMVRLVLTATDALYDQVVAGFQEFIESVRPETPEDNG